MHAYRGVALMFLCAVLHTAYGYRCKDSQTSLGWLPTDLWPSHYVVEVWPDFYTGQPPFYFNGSVEMTFECTTPTTVIYLGSRRLTIDESTLYVVVDPDSPVQGPDPVWIKTETDETFEVYKVFLDDNLLEGAVYRMGMSFSGEIAEPSEQLGLFYTSYTSVNDGSTKYQVATQLQSTHGRRIFPHFAEAPFKATFDTTLVRKSHMTALSNGNLISSEDRGNDWIADTFNTTVKMSSYLNCYIIGEYDYMESISASGMPVRVYSRPEYAQDLVFANSVAADVHDFYEQYTDFIDPMPKLDHVAVPGFGVGAMENWGLIPYIEEWVLYNESTDTLQAQRDIVGTIGHESSHLWFGDLVTCNSWIDSWLNEGFAVFFGDLTFEAVWPNSANDKALQGQIRNLLISDSYVTSAPVRGLQNTPLEAASTSTTYGKGSATLRVLRQILGADTLMRGLQTYLTKFQFSVVDTDELWQVLTEQAEIDGVTDSDGTKLFIKEKMDPWIDQTGYPLVTVTRTAPGTADVTQSRFLSPAGQSAPLGPFLDQWYVPISIISQTDPDLDPYPASKDWLNRNNKTITNGIPDSMDEWFIVNVDQSGFFRVQYDIYTYFQIADQLDANASVLLNSNRFSLLNDAFEITRAGLETEVHAMEATRFLDQEDSYLVWDTADMHLAYPSLILARYASTYAEFEAYMSSKADPAYVKFGWDNTGSDNSERTARAMVIDLACNYGNTDCAQEARVRFDSLMADPSTNSIAVDQRLPVYCTTMRTGSETDWNALHSVYMGIKDNIWRNTEDEVDRILSGLACSEDDAILQSYIALTFDPAQINNGDVYFAVYSIATANRGRWVMWEHLNNTWFNNPLPPGVDKWGILHNVVNGFASDEDIFELEVFIAKYPPGNQYETDMYNIARDIIADNNKWADDNQADLDLWLRGHVTSSVSRGTQKGCNHGMRERLQRIRDVRHRRAHSPWYNMYKFLLTE